MDINGMPIDESDNSCTLNTKWGEVVKSEFKKLSENSDFIASVKLELNKIPKYAMEHLGGEEVVTVRSAVEVLLPKKLWSYLIYCYPVRNNYKPAKTTFYNLLRIRAKAADEAKISVRDRVHYINGQFYAHTSWFYTMPHRYFSHFSVGAFIPDNKIDSNGVPEKTPIEVSLQVSARALLRALADIKMLKQKLSRKRRK